MKIISLAEIRANLSRYVAQTRAGTTLFIVERGVPIARLEPLSWKAEPEAIMETLEATGVVRPPQQALQETPRQRKGVGKLSA